LLSLAGGDVVVTGKTPDVEPYLRRAAVMAAPLRFGGGVRVKVLEAMAAGIPVVASPIAAAEISVEHLRLADADAEFADALVDLLEHPAERRLLGEGGRRWVTEHASSARMVTSLEAVHDTLIAPLERAA
jgi:glycosyltransferase involved in cell wall biosynthesis